MIFFQRKILRISTIFSNFKQNKQFSKKNSENFQGLKFFKFSLNFHSIFKRNFWFCEIHLKIERNWEKKKITKIYRSFDGRVEKSNFGKFWLIFGTIFWKINLIFWQLPILQQFSQNSIIHFLKSLEKPWKTKNK